MWKQRRALPAAVRYRNQLAGLNVRHGRRNGSPEQGHATAKHVLQRRSASLVRNMLELDAGGALKDLHRHVRRRPDAVGCIVDFAGFGLGQRYQVRNRFDLARRGGNQDQRQCGDHADRLEIGQGVVRQFVLHERNDPGNTIVGQEQRVTVRRRLGRRVGCDHAVAARAVVDHHRLAPQCAKSDCEIARNEIDRAARGKRNQQLDRPVRKTALGKGRHGDPGDCHQQCGQSGAMNEAWARVCENRNSRAAKRCIHFHREVAE